MVDNRWTILSRIALPDSGLQSCQLELSYSSDGKQIDVISTVGRDTRYHHVGPLIQPLPFDLGQIFNRAAVRRKESVIPHLEHSDAYRTPTYIVSFKQEQELTITTSQHSESYRTVDLEYHFNARRGKVASM